MLDALEDEIDFVGLVGGEDDAVFLVVALEGGVVDVVELFGFHAVHVLRVVDGGQLLEVKFALVLLELLVHVHHDAVVLDRAGQTVLAGHLPAAAQLVQRLGLNLLRDAFLCAETEVEVHLEVLVFEL